MTTARFELHVYDDDPRHPAFVKITVEHSPAVPLFVDMLRRRGLRVEWNELPVAPVPSGGVS